MESGDGKQGQGEADPCPLHISSLPNIMYLTKIEFSKK